MIFGAGAFARTLARALVSRGFEVAGFIVSQRQSLARLDGMGVYELSEVGAESAVRACQLICGVFNRDHNYLELSQIAASYGWTEMAMPWDYYPLLADDLGWRYWLSRFPLGSDQDPLMLSMVASVDALLADEESRSILARTVAFRSGQDLDYASYISVDPQYFNRLSLGHPCLAPGFTYLDVGAFDGRTFLNLAGQSEVGRALLFEPNPDSYQMLTNVLANWIDSRVSDVTAEIEIFPFGLSDRNACLPLYGGGESSSFQLLASPDPELRWSAVVRADDIFPTANVHCIKIDAEGAEREVLMGLANLIKRCQPLLAVSVYHREGDIVSLPLLVHQLLEGADYDFYLDSMAATHLIAFSTPCHGDLDSDRFEVGGFCRYWGFVSMGVLACNQPYKVLDSGSMGIWIVES